MSEQDTRRYDPGCTADYSHDGLCPCCGLEIESITEEKWTGQFGTVLVITTDQFCPGCLWRSVELIDDVNDSED